MLQKYQFMSFCSIFPKICCIKYCIEAGQDASRLVVSYDKWSQSPKTSWRRPTLVLSTIIYLIHFSVSNLSVSLHLYVNIHLQLLTYYQFQLSMQCTIKFGRSSYLVLHFPPLREFKDFPNARQSKLSLCNGDVVQRHYRMK